MMSILQRFLDKNEEEQMLYRFGRRLGAFTSLEDIHDTPRRERVIQVMSENKVNPQNIDNVIDQLMQRFV